MMICGIKVTHDGGIALIDGNRLVTSIEMEKLDNRLRYSPLGDLRRVPELLLGEGVSPTDVSRFVVDGWWAEQPELGVAVPTTLDGARYALPVAPYSDESGVDPVHRYTFGGYDFGRPGSGYASYHHAAGHLLASYCTSPFAARGEDAVVLVWDGGLIPHLYEVRAADRTVHFIGSPVRWHGNLFGDVCGFFDPFRADTTDFDHDAHVRLHLSVAGKAMAYAALGTVHEEAFAVFDRLLGESPVPSLEDAFRVGSALAAGRDHLLPGLSNADIIATLQEYIGRELTRQVGFLLHRRYPHRVMNLCLGGGCALNIKWNSSLRDSGIFAEVWAPPFANDSGAAIGAACCEMFRRGHLALDWSVYSGPALADKAAPVGWEARPCDERELALLLHTENEPVVVLDDRAELGPRALGNRSILAPATSIAMKDRLNLIKGRAAYRPVAPVCLATRSSEVFDPGGHDPYMLFEHRLRDGWAERIPAVVHLDGTARLQTISADDSSVTGRILAEYERISGIPVLCNTSANGNGHGFFPDVASAADWGGTRYVWSRGKLYLNPDPDPDATRPLR